TAPDPLAAFVRVTDTDHDAESVQALAEEHAVDELPDPIAEDQARQLESQRYEAFGLGPSAGALAAPEAFAGGDTLGSSGATGGGTVDGASTDGGDTESGENDTVEDAPAATSAEPPAPQARMEADGQMADPLADVRRCLPEIVSTATEPVIPLFAEVATFDGEPAIIYLVLTREPGDRLFGRIEAWVVGRADCFPVLFQQIAR
ncbi:MAG TPA: hypothetical protein VGA69_03020, partial [Nitriliruptorales bacterium]